jgi:hypothetical protein
MGDKSTLLILVLCALTIGGFVNYRRNAPLDAELQSRTYADLKDRDLDTLIQAYEEETRRLRAWVDQEPLAKVPSQALDDSDLGGKVKTFERYQRETNRWRSLRQEVLQREATLEALNKEKDLRARGLDERWRQILRRLITL